MATNTRSQGVSHTFVCGGRQFTVPIRYQEPVFIGKGVSGVVM